MYVADGLLGNRVAIIHKVHHALADGVASANQIAKALDGASMGGRRAASVSPTSPPPICCVPPRATTYAKSVGRPISSDKPPAESLRCGDVPANAGRTPISRPALHRRRHS